MQPVSERSSSTGQGNKNHSKTSCHCKCTVGLSMYRHQLSGWLQLPLRNCQQQQGDGVTEAYGSVGTLHYASEPVQKGAHGKGLGGPVPRNQCVTDSQLGPS